MNQSAHMDDVAIDIVKDYVVKNYPNGKSATVFTVWKCKTLQNWKYLLSTDLCDGVYYELTYNGDKEEWYLDVYHKFENIVVRRGEE